MRLIILIISICALIVATLDDLEFFARADWVAFSLVALIWLAAFACLLISTLFWRLVRAL